MTLRIEIPQGYQETASMQGGKGDFALVGDALQVYAVDAMQRQRDGAPTAYTEAQVASAQRWWNALGQSQTLPTVAEGHRNVPLHIAEMAGSGVVLAFGVLGGENFGLADKQIVDIARIARGDRLDKFGEALLEFQPLLHYISGLPPDLLAQIRNKG